MNHGASVFSTAVHALAAANTTISRTLLDDANNHGQAKAWLISTLAEQQQQQQQHTTQALRMACFDPCSLPAHNPNHQHDSYDRTCDRHDDIYDSAAGSRGSSRQGVSDSSRRPESTQQQQQQQQRELSPVASCKPAALQLLQLLCDAQPSAVAQLLTRDPRFLCSCLIASPATTAAWFGQFSLAGIQHFRHGARALANYALTHRSDVWQHLVWAGKHDQAPVAVAGKPHYFAELDVDRTMLGLARRCPDFWASEELAACCQNGEWLQLEPDLVLQELHRLLHEPRSSRHALLRQLISSFLAAADWTLLCNRLLPLLQEQQLLAFARLLAQQQQAVQGHSMRSRQRQQRLGSVGHWLEEQAIHNGTAGSTAAAASQLPCVQQLRVLVLCPSAQQWTLDQLLLANALTCHRQQLLLLLQQEDEAEQLLQLVAAAQQLFGQQQQGQPQQSAQQATAVSAGARGGQQGGGAAAAVQQVVKTVTDSAADWPEQQLRLLLVGWLLRLQLLLAAASGPAEASKALAVYGCSCHLIQPPQQQQQQQAAADPGSQAGHEQVGQPARQPLRRGSTAAAMSQDHRVQQKARSRKVKKDKSSKHKHKQMVKRRHSQKDSSCSSPHDDSDDSAGARPAHKRSRRSSRQHHKKKRRRVHRSSSDSDSSSSSSSSKGSKGSMDLDAGGELLDPAAFPPWTHAAAAAASESAGGSVGAAAKAALLSRPAGTGAGAATADEKQEQLTAVLAALSGAGLQGRQHGPWLVQLPTAVLPAAGAAAGAGGRGSGDNSNQDDAAGCCAVRGTAVEVMDAAAWYCTWQLMRHAVDGK
ncbi:hypothetical protein COO60DRAFT_522094 [Scenedesmus sp. NREL 46B-D3]|nr:hypothetical protein COO60DRAFT_522094 [Scenedesmus sp. NREL 46B-D3]